MPNWTGNSITVKGNKEKLDIFKLKVKGEKSAFDFDRIRPMPEELDIEKGSNTNLGLACWDQEYFKKESAYPWFPDRYPDITTPEQLRTFLTKDKPEIVELGKQALDNIHRYGATTWYDWCIDNWGTKWNASEIEGEEYGNTLTYRFDTAWDCPRPLVEPIVEMAQELGLSIVWTADHEDGGFEPIFDSKGEFKEAA